MPTLDAMIDAAVRAALVKKIDQLQDQVAALRSDYRKAVDDIVASGGFLPNNYWVPLRRAENQLRATIAALEEWS